MPNREGSAQWWHLHQNWGGGKGVREKICMQKYIFATFMLKLSSKFRGGKGGKRKNLHAEIYFAIFMPKLSNLVKVFGSKRGGGGGGEENVCGENVPYASGPLTSV